VINVVADKRPSDTSDLVFDRTWTALIQSFEDTLSHRNFPRSRDHAMEYDGQLAVKQRLISGRLTVEWRLTGMLLLCGHEA
jgi:hypothetical protein